MDATQTITAEHLIKPSTFADPYPIYRSLRDHSPLRYRFFPGSTSSRARSPVWTWGFLKYQDAYTALRDHDTFSSEDPLAGLNRPKLVLINDDRPRHSQFRRLLNRTFTAERIEALQPRIMEIANTLLDKIGEGATDVIESYAAPLPGRVTADLLGIPEESYATFRRWSVSFFSTGPDRSNQRLENMREMVTYFGQMAAERRRDGAEDFITALLEAEIEGRPLQDSEVLGTCITLLVAGNITTTNLIGNLLGILADRPELWQQLREDRSLMETVIEETVRYESPAQRIARRATRDVEISGVKISKEDRVTIFFGAANRDPKAFPDPDSFLLDRDLRGHVGFGMGIHYCLGAPLARAEAQITLNALLDRFPVIKRADAPAVRQKASAIAFGFERLPLIFTAKTNGGTL